MWWDVYFLGLEGGEGGVCEGFEEIGMVGGVEVERREGGISRHRGWGCSNYEDVFRCFKLTKM